MSGTTVAWIIRQICPPVSYIGTIRVYSIADLAACTLCVLYPARYPSEFARFRYQRELHLTPSICDLSSYGHVRRSYQDRRLSHQLQLGIKLASMVKARDNVMPGHAPSFAGHTEPYKCRMSSPAKLRLLTRPGQAVASMLESKHKCMPMLPNSVQT